MNASSIRPRVFVSSVIEGFRAERRSARQAISRAGGEPIMAEDFGSRDESPRNACLDAVASCDAMVLIIGSRGGFTAPSKKLVVEEEYEEAKRLALPVLLYLGDVDRDPDAQRLATKLSSLVAGRFRTTYTSPTDLQSQIERDIIPVLETLSMPTTDKDLVNTLLLREDNKSNNHIPTIRTVVVPERLASFESAIDASNVKGLYAIAHECDLFSYQLPKRDSEGSESLALMQYAIGNDYTPIDRVMILENGIITVESTLENRDTSSDTVLSMISMQVPAQRIDARLSAALSFIHLLYEKFDPYLRHLRFQVNAALLHHQSVLISRELQPTSRVSIPVFQTPDIVPAFADPKTISREELANAVAFAASTVDRILRRRRANRD